VSGVHLYKWTMDDDMKLVREYASRQSEQAFETLVQRNVNLVYSAALRQVHNPHLAEEITQTVFVILARKAASLAPQTALPGWLYRTTHYVSAAALKIQHRRERREQEAYVQAMMQEAQTDSAWEQFSPLLDEAMSQLRDRDRDAIVLRYFQNRSLREVGAVLGVDEYAAQKRVGRALERLRSIFAKRGINSTVTIIIGAISANSVRAAPVALTKSVTTVALTKGTIAGASTLTLIKTALKLMAWTNAKTAAVAVAVIIVATGTTTLVIQHQHKPQLPQVTVPVGADFPRSSWAFAGYTNPQSAFLSATWSLSVGDLERFLASLTPDERGRQLQQLKDGAQEAGKSVADFFTSIGTQGNMPNTTGYRVLDQQIISDDQMILHVILQRTVPGNEQQVIEAKIIKTGNEWKVDEQRVVEKAR
jgi:RNA polymerase sigma factor (sigma-70 family)